MSTRVDLRVVALACGLGLAGCASKDKAAGEPDRTDQVRRGVADAATMPLRDVGLIRAEIPAPLAGLRYPYDNDRLMGGCPQVLYEVGRLDAVLGSESYQPGTKRDRTVLDRGGDAAADAAVNAVEGATNDIVPFRGWVRKASGADKADRELAQAIEMGQTRRAFLRGYGAALGCIDVVPPPPPNSRDADPRTPPPAARDAGSRRPR